MSKKILNEEKKYSFYFFLEIYQKFKKQASESEKILNVYKNKISANLPTSSILENEEQASRSSKFVISFENKIDKLRKASVMNLRVFTFWRSANSNKKIASQFNPNVETGVMSKVGATLSSLGGWLKNKVGISEGLEEHAKTDWDENYIVNMITSKLPSSDDKEQFFGKGEGKGYITKGILEMLSEVAKFPDHNEGLYQTFLKGTPQEYYTNCLEAFQSIRDLTEQVRGLIKSKNTSDDAAAKDFEEKKSVVDNAGVDLSDEELMLILQYSNLSRKSGPLQEAIIKYNDEIISKYFIGEKAEKLKAALKKIEGNPDLLKQLGIAFEESEEDKPVEIKSLDDVYNLDGKPYTNDTMEKAYYFLQKRVTGERAEKDLYFAYTAAGPTQITSFEYDQSPSTSFRAAEISRIKPVVKIGGTENARGNFVSVDTTNKPTFKVKKDMVITKEPDAPTYEDSDVKLSNEGDKEVLDKFYDYLRQEIGKIDEAIDNKRVKKITGVDIAKIIEEFKFSGISDEEYKRFSKIAQQQAIKLTQYTIKVIKSRQEAKKKAKDEKDKQDDSQALFDLIPDMQLDDIKSEYGSQIETGQLENDTTKAIFKRLKEILKDEVVQFEYGGKTLKVQDFDIDKAEAEDIEIYIVYNNFAGYPLSNYLDSLKSSPRVKTRKFFGKIKDIKYDIDEKYYDLYKKLAERSYTRTLFEGSSFEQAFISFINFIGDVKNESTLEEDAELPVKDLNSRLGIPTSFIDKMKKVFTKLESDKKDDIIDFFKLFKKKQELYNTYKAIGDIRQSDLGLDEKIKRMLMPLIRNVVRKQWPKRIM